MTLAFFLAILLVPSDTLSIGGVLFEQTRLTGGPGGSEMAMADLDLDGHLDLLVVSSPQATLAVFSGDGTGSFGDALSYPAGPNPTMVSAADLDGDGLPDVIIANHEATFLTVLPGLGAQGFGPGVRHTIEVLPHPHWVMPVDADGDGLLDLVVDDRRAEALLVLRGLGDGSFAKAETRIAVGGDPYLGFTSGDLNEDGFLDWVTPNPRSVGITLGRGGTQHEPPSQWAVPFRPSAVALCDINGDGHLDLAAASGDASQDAQTSLGNGQGQFGPGTRHRLGRGIKKLGVADLNGDGFCDVLGLSWGGGAQALVGGTGQVRPVALGLSGNPWGLAVGDLNGDGADDFAVSDGQTNVIHVFTSIRR
ncbi:MAG: hypothetical protein ACI9W4_002991 [Rhodothermales bacterium]|jgi:hypothetical protein